MLSLFSACEAFTLSIKPSSVVAHSRAPMPVMLSDERVVNLQMAVDVGEDGTLTRPRSLRRCCTPGAALP